MLQRANDFLGKLRIADWAARPEPSEGPIDHAHEHHGQCCLILIVQSLGISASQKPSERAHDIALALHDQHALRDTARFNRVAQKFCIVEQSNMGGR